jgi:NAD kinase
MRVTAELSVLDIKTAIVEYCNKRGFETSVDKVLISTTPGDRPGESTTYSASASGSYVDPMCSSTKSSSLGNQITSPDNWRS